MNFLDGIALYSDNLLATSLSVFVKNFSSSGKFISSMPLSKFIKLSFGSNIVFNSVSAFSILNENPLIV